MTRYYLLCNGAKAVTCTCEQQGMLNWLFFGWGSLFLVYPVNGTVWCDPWFIWTSAFCCLEIGWLSG